MRKRCWLLALGCWLFTLIQSSAQTKPLPSGNTSQVCGPIADGVLKCPRFGFTYKVPFGWVDRTQDMQNEDTQNQGAATASPAKSETLLAIFERPPAAPGETINSAVVIAAEPLKDYPQIKTASDYFGPISELAEQRGFKVEQEPYAVSLGAKQLLRGDFSKARGQLTMRQSSLVMIEKGYIVSFTFLAGDEDEADRLIERLSFAVRAHGTPNRH